MNSAVVSQKNIYRNYFAILFLFNYLCIIYIIFYCCSSSLHFPTTTYPLPTHLYLPPSILMPIGFVRGPSIHVPWWSFPFFHTFSPSAYPSAYCQCVLYLNFSSYILLVCLFCWLGSTYWWDHMVFFPYCLVSFTQHNVFQFHPCSCKRKEPLLPFYHVVFHCIMYHSF